VAALGARLIVYGLYVSPSACWAFLKEYESASRNDPASLHFSYVKF